MLEFPHAIELRVNHHIAFRVALGNPCATPERPTSCYQLLIVTKCAAIGALAGGGKGAAIGALAGGGGGFAYDRMTHNR